MRVGLAVAVALLAPGCVRLNPAYGDGAEAEEGSGAGTSMSTGGTAPADTGSTLVTASASGVTGTSMLPTTASGPGPDVAASGPSSESEGVPLDWWDAEYRHRVELTFLARAQPLSGFVTYVPLTLSSALLEGVTPAQLAFFDVDSGTRIPAEVSRIDAEAGEVRAWVQLPTWKSGETTSVFLYFGSSAPEVPSASPWGGHVAVWHMDGISKDGLTFDAGGTADAMQVEPIPVPIGQVEGVVGGALEFDGETQRLGAVLSPPPDDDSFLVSAWVNVASFPTEGFPVIARGDSVGLDWVQSEWAMGSDGPRAEGHVHDAGSNGVMPPNVGVVVPPTGGWHHYAFLYTGSSIRFYLDGVGSASAAINTELDHALDTVSIGGYSSPITDGWENRLLNGRIDELRWRRGAIDDDPNNVWVQTLIASQQDPASTFFPVDVESL